MTKHDINMANRRNACRVMEFPPEFHTGDGGGFDMKLSNQVKAPYIFCDIVVILFIFITSGV